MSNGPRVAVLGRQTKMTEAEQMANRIAMIEAENAINLAAQYPNKKGYQAAAEKARAIYPRLCIESELYTDWTLEPVGGESAAEHVERSRREGILSRPL